MREIPVSRIFIFSLLFSLIITCALASTLMLRLLPFKTDLILQIIFFGISFVGFSLLIYGVFRKLAPFPTGTVSPGTRHEFVYHVDALFHLGIFNLFTITGLLPLPLRRVWYNCLGARLGHTTYPAGTILDPRFVQIGDTCVIGFRSLICPHILVGTDLQHQSIQLGDNVTIGVAATIFGGTSIGNQAVVLPHSVVKPNTVIKAGEIWGGIPAVKIKEQTIETPDLSNHKKWPTGEQAI